MAFLIYLVGPNITRNLLVTTDCVKYLAEHDTIFLMPIPTFWNNEHKIVHIVVKRSFHGRRFKYTDKIGYILSEQNHPTWSPLDVEI